MKLFKVYIKKHLKFLIIPFLAMIVTVAIDSTFPYLQKIFVDNILLGGKSNLLIQFFSIFICLALSRSILGYVKEFLFDKFSIIVSKEIRQDLFNKIQTFEFSFFDTNNTGELLSRISEDVDIVWETISYGLRLLIEGIILLIISSTVMFSMNWSLTILCLIILLPVGFLGLIYNNKFWNIYSQISDQTAEINSIAQQNISGIRLVKAFAREKYEITKFLKVNNEYYKLNVAQAKIVSNFIPFIDFLCNLAPIAMIIFGGYLTITKNLSAGTLVAFSSYVLSLSGTVRFLGSLINLLSQNKASMEKIFALLERESLITSPESAFAPSKVKGNITFKNVSLKYNDNEVIHNITLDIPAGSTVAIMGETGSGKSSLLSLIGRYYDAYSGEILVDGVNVKSWSLDILRSNMSVVFQDTFLFSDSIKNNIAFGRNYSDSEIKKASLKSCAHDFISEMPDGYETIVGERGVGLSGGQKQRLAITRALIKNSPILILDDATSALDMETELQVLRNLSTEKVKSTTFIIAHRISGVKDADLILFMKDGKIVEMGNHTSLLKQKGYYYDVYCHQFKDFDSLVSEVS